MAHILPQWNWPGRQGQVTPVHVYTSGDETELFLNGKSPGKKGEYEYHLKVICRELVISFPVFFY